MNGIKKLHILEEIKRVAPHYKIGQLIHHKLFNYRGVIFKVNDCFQLTDTWYDNVAKSKPPKENPWYSVLVHNQAHTTYVAERHIIPDNSDIEIIHPMIPIYFTTVKNGLYAKSINWIDGEPTAPNEIGLA